MTSTIEWTDRHDWNPIRGCTRVSPGCGGPGPHGGCYAEAMAARFSDVGQWGNGYAVRTPQGGRWTGLVALQYDRLTLPIRWAEGQPGRNKCFITSTSDPFHESLSDPEIDLLFAVMALRPDWTFQVLTKRSDRMREWFERMAEPHKHFSWVHDDDWDGAWTVLAQAAEDAGISHFGISCEWPLPNVWLGVSVEDQQRANERIPDLLSTPAAVRWISAEPLLGPVDLRILHHDGVTNIDALAGRHGVNIPMRGACSKLDWVVTGGESGARHRDNDFEANARSLRDQCAAAGVAFYGKQNVGKRPLPQDLQIREFPA